MFELENLIPNNVECSNVKKEKLKRKGLFENNIFK